MLYYTTRNNNLEITFPARYNYLSLVYFLYIYLAAIIYLIQLHFFVGSFFLFFAIQLIDIYPVPYVLFIIHEKLYIS